MTLKQKLAIKYIYKELMIFDPKKKKDMEELIEKAYVAGFDKAKLLYLDYGKRFLSPQDNTVMEKIGE